jgi:hypothetical protein
MCGRKSGGANGGIAAHCTSLGDLIIPSDQPRTEWLIFIPRECGTLLEYVLEAIDIRNKIVHESYAE